MIATFDRCRALCFSLGAIISLWLFPAQGREGWEARPLACDPTEQGDNLTKCQQWISQVKQPAPNDATSCCGQADAFLADDFEYDKAGNLIAIISENYPAVIVDDDDGTYAEIPAHPKGSRVAIPPDKVNEAWRHGGNPSTHGIVFIDTVGNVLCYFFPPLT